MRPRIAVVALVLAAGCSPSAPTPTSSGVVVSSPPFALTSSDHAAVQAGAEQTVYVPVYSYINTGHEGRLYNLAVTLAVRNTDPRSPLVITAIDYYDTNGQKKRSWLERPVRLAAMAAYEVYIREGDTSGGLGASFRVRWLRQATGQSEPLIQAVHAGTASAQGISFVTEGVTVDAGSEAIRDKELTTHE